MISIKLFLGFILMLFLVAGCELPIDNSVFDDPTQERIENAAEKYIKDTDDFMNNDGRYFRILSSEKDVSCNNCWKVKAEYVKDSNKGIELVKARIDMEDKKLKDVGISSKTLILLSPDACKQEAGRVVNPSTDECTKHEQIIGEVTGLMKMHTCCVNDIAAPKCDYYNHVYVCSGYIKVMSTKPGVPTKHYTPDGTELDCSDESNKGCKKLIMGDCDMIC